MLLIPHCCATSKRNRSRIQSREFFGWTGTKYKPVKFHRMDHTFLSLEMMVTHMIAALAPSDRSQDRTIDSGRTARFNDLSWHPNGETALIAGDYGAALRYSFNDNSIEAVNGAGIVGNPELTATSWRAGGDLAFFGAKNGDVYSFNEGEGLTN